MTFCVSRARRVVLTAIVCTMGFLAVCAAPAAAADRCVDVRFVAVRGSGEAGEVFGNTANAIYKAMLSYVPIGTTTALTGIHYAAVGMGKSGTGKTVGTLGLRYQSSKSGGVRNLDTYLDEQDSCLSERWVLIGFSQGAHVVGDALSSSDGTLDDTQQSKLAAVVLLADPRFNPQEIFVAGTYSVARYGLAGKRPKGDLTRAVGKIRSWCDADDFVCQGVGTDNSSSVHSGTRYVEAHKSAITSLLRGKLGWSSRVYVNTIPGGGAMSRPMAISVGNGQCTPYFSGLRWSRWGDRTARATGRVTYRQPGAGESCGSAPDIVRRVTVTLTGRSTCHGRRYYRNLRSTGTQQSFRLDCGRSQG